MRDRFIFFDFDGVIADSFAVALDVHKIICPDMTEDDYRKMFEGNVNDWESAVSHNENCRHDIDWFATYVPRMTNEVRPIEGIGSVIAELAKLYQLIIISSTITSPIHEFMQKFDLAHHFVEIMGNDVHASKVEKIKMVFAKYGTSPERCVFITDTLGDMKEATQAGVGSIVVSWGFNKLGILAKGDPFRIVHQPHEIPSTVSEYFGRGGSGD